MPSLRVETLTNIADLSSVSSEWNDLYLEASPGHPFFLPEWTVLWWKHLRQESSSMRDLLQLRAIRTAGGRLVGIAPLVLTERPAVGPVRARYLDFIGADPNITEVRGVLAHPDCAGDVYTALAESLSSGPKWDWHCWRGVPSDVAGTVVGGLISQPLDDLPMSLLDLAPTWEEFKSGLKRNIRESLRKCYNSLKREEIAFDLRVAQTRDEVAPAVERFLALHASRADVEGTIQHRNVFDASAAQAFLRDICGSLADNGYTRVFEMVIDGQTVASRVGFQLADTLYLYYSGYDPAWGKYSVMTTTVAEAIQYAIAHGLTTVNLSTGLDVSKTRWGPRHVTFFQGVQVAPATRSRLAYQVYQQALRLKEHQAARWISRHA